MVHLILNVSYFVVFELLHAMDSKVKKKKYLYTGKFLSNALPSCTIPLEIDLMSVSWYLSKDVNDGFNM